MSLARFVAVRTRLLCAGIALSLAPAILAAQELTAIRAGRLVDVERGTVLLNQVVLIRGERVEAVQPASTAIPRGARVIDLSAYTVMPGLIDCHTDRKSTRLNSSHG